MFIQVGVLHDRYFMLHYTSTNTQYYDPVFTHLVLPPVLLDMVEEEEVLLGSDFLSVV